MVTVQIWYMKPEHFRDGMMGADWLRERNKTPDPANLEKTHVQLMEMYAEGNDIELERIYASMQGERWSPNGEARPLIKSKGLQHTSMSVGDIVVRDGKAHMVDRFGFVELGG